MVDFLGKEGWVDKNSKGQEGNVAALYLQFLRASDNRISSNQMEFAANECLD